MTDTPGHAPVKSIMPKWVRGPQDFVGGVALMAIALFALWASSDLQGMHGFSFGAGTAPRMFAVLLLGLGAAIALVGILSEGQHLAAYHWRGPLFVSLSILSFAVTIRPLGLVISAFASFMIAALGTPRPRERHRARHRQGGRGRRCAQGRRRHPIRDAFALHRRTLKRSLPTDPIRCPARCRRSRRRRRISSRT